MKESPYYGSTSANESSTKDNTRITTQNSNNSNSRSTRYLSYSHNVSDWNLLLHHLRFNKITLLHRNIGPVEREQANFPRSYVQSTHRQDFFDRFVADEEIETPATEGEQNENTRPPTSSWVEDTTVSKVLAKFNTSDRNKNTASVTFDIGVSTF